MAVAILLAITSFPMRRRHQRSRLHLQRNRRQSDPVRRCSLWERAHRCGGGPWNAYPRTAIHRIFKRYFSAAPATTQLQETPASAMSRVFSPRTTIG